MWLGERGGDYATYFVLARGLFVIALEEIDLGGKEDAEEDELDDDDEEDDEDEEGDDDDEEEEEEVSDSSSELEESIVLTFPMGLFNDGRIAGDFRTTRPGSDIAIGCDRLRFLTRDGSLNFKRFPLSTKRSTRATKMNKNTPSGLTSKSIATSPPCCVATAIPSPAECETIFTQTRSPSLTAPNGQSSSNSNSSTNNATSLACSPPALNAPTRRHNEFLRSKIVSGTFCTSGTNHALTSGRGL